MTPDDLTPTWRFLYEERAAIMTWDAGLPKEEAERLALLDIVAVLAREQKRQHGGGLYR